MGAEACSSLEPIPACPSPTPRAREAQQVPQECDQTRGAGWLGGLSSSLPAVSLAPSTVLLSWGGPGGGGGVVGRGNGWSRIPPMAQMAAEPALLVQRPESVYICT